MILLTVWFINGGTEAKIFNSINDFNIYFDIHFNSETWRNSIVDYSVRYQPNKKEMP